GQSRWMRGGGPELRSQSEDSTPRVDDRHVEGAEVLDVARDEGQTMDCRSGRDQGIALRPGIWDMESTGTARNWHVDRQNSACERIEQLVIEPRLQAIGLSWIAPAQPRDPHLHFQHRDRREEEIGGGLRGHPGTHAGVRPKLGLTELADDVGVEQIAHRSGTASSMRAGSNSMSRSSSMLRRST